ncbi:MAG: LptF/LptG family permease [Niabella sp.]
MKKLDKLIIKAFIGPFVATFFITLFVLIMQFFWLWIDDFVGKGLDAGTILKFIWYQSAVLIPLALPLSILLSSLMTFGNLGESFELVAIKSAGISLLRFMRPLFVVAGIISIGAFLFSNYVIPVANLKSRTLLADIVLAKPAFAIKEGVFFDGIDNFAIKIGKKEPNDSIIRDIIVYQNSNNQLQDNFLVARDGVMKPSPNKRFLDVIFKNGWRYQERGSRTDSSTEYIRLGFKEYKMQMDISSFNFKKSDDSANVNNERMYNMRQLDVAIDSMSKFHNQITENFNRGLFSNVSLLTYKDSVAKGVKIPDSVLNFKENIKAYMNPANADSLKKKKDSLQQLAAKADVAKKIKADTATVKKTVAKHRKRKSLPANAAVAKTIKDSSDTLKKPAAKPVAQADTGRKKSTDTANAVVMSPDTARSQKDSAAQSKTTVVKPVKKDPGSFDAIIPDSARERVKERALSTLNGLKANIEMNGNRIADQSKALQKYKIEWHRKIALALACMVLFMIGAPLGSIIRKGGLGSPMIFAIIFFMIFYFVSTRGEKLAKEDQISAFAGMWLSTFVLVPVGIFLTYKAMHDSNLFNKEFYVRLKRTFLKKIGKASKA